MTRQISLVRKTCRIVHQTEGVTLSFLLVTDSTYLHGLSLFLASTEIKCFSLGNSSIIHARINSGRRTR